MQILSNYNTKSLYHFENSVIVALKSDIFTFYTCQIFLTTLKMNKCQFLKQNKDLASIWKIEKKLPDATVIQKYQKQILRLRLGGYFHYLRAPRDPKGVKSTIIH